MMAATCATARAIWTRCLIGSSSSSSGVAAATASRVKSGSGSASRSGSVHCATSFRPEVVWQARPRGATAAHFQETEGEGFAVGEARLLCGAVSATRLCDTSPNPTGSRRLAGGVKTTRLCDTACCGNRRRLACQRVSATRLCAVSATRLCGGTCPTPTGRRRLAGGVSSTRLCDTPCCANRRRLACGTRERQRRATTVAAHRATVSVLSSALSITPSSSSFASSSSSPCPFCSSSSISSRHHPPSSLTAYGPKRHVAAARQTRDLHLLSWQLPNQKAGTRVGKARRDMAARSAGEQSYPYSQKTDEVDSTSSSTSSTFSLTSSSGKPVGEKCIEHVVLFKVKQGTSPDDVANMLYALRDLGSLSPPLDGVIDVSCGELMSPILSLSPLFSDSPSSPSLSSSSFSSSEERERREEGGEEGKKREEEVEVILHGSGGFTHGLCVRCRDEESLKSYAAHPRHVSVVTQYIKPIIEDVMALDWQANLSTAAVDGLGAQVIRFGAIKLKDGVSAEDIARMVDTCQRCEGLLPRVRQFTIGQNFAPERAKGYEWGFLARFGNLQDWMAYVRDIDQCAIMNEVVKPLASSVLIADFMAKSNVFSSSRL
ncbi:hypothetical protein CBR_g78881 [Chara braunii]|uniref:Stress-response A/B barrel domain-containing protein n=1 Tax=Chara braunii TaxID=69332 RepID=A0A388KAM8_CHABU|nr:hypothetical protein CBR_g78881 [Chara braunii]|eukprot:GBG67100.1 hypothetical protein CBR_g78881 [Chara braunii]